MIVTAIGYVLTFESDNVYDFYARGFRVFQDNER